MLLAQEEGLLGALLGDLYDDAVHERFLVALKEMMAVEEVRKYPFLCLCSMQFLCLNCM